MREQAGEPLARGSEFWTELQAQNPDAVSTKPPPRSGRPRRRRNSSANRKPGDA